MKRRGRALPRPLHRMAVRANLMMRASPESVVRGHVLKGLRSCATTKTHVPWVMPVSTVRVSQESRLFVRAPRDAVFQERVMRRQDNAITPSRPTEPAAMTEMHALRIRAPWRLVPAHLHRLK